MAKCDLKTKATAARVCDCLTPAERTILADKAKTNSCANALKDDDMSGYKTKEVRDTYKGRIAQAKARAAQPQPDAPAPAAPQPVVVQPAPAPVPEAPKAAIHDDIIARLTKRETVSADDVGKLTEEHIFDGKRTVGDRSALMGVADNRVKSLATAAKIAAGDDDLSADDIKAMDVSVIRSMHIKSGKDVLAGIDKVLGQSEIHTDKSVIRKLNDLKSKLGGVATPATPETTAAPVGSGSRIVMSQEGGARIGAYFRTSTMPNYSHSVRNPDTGAEMGENGFPQIAYMPDFEQANNLPFSSWGFGVYGGGTMANGLRLQADLQMSFTEYSVKNSDTRKSLLKIDNVDRTEISAFLQALKEWDFGAVRFAAGGGPVLGFGWLNDSAHAKTPLGNELIMEGHELSKFGIIGLGLKGQAELGPLALSLDILFNGHIYGNEIFNVSTSQTAKLERDRSSPVYVGVSAGISFDTIWRYIFGK